MSLLQALGVEYVLVDRDKLGLESTPAEALVQRAPALEHLQDFGPVSVYRVLPAAFDGNRLKKSLFLPQPAQAGGSYVAYLIVANKSATPFALSPIDRVDLTARWSDGRTETKSLQMRLVTSTVSVLPVPLTAPRRQGSFRLDLTARGGLIGSFELSGQVQVGDEPARETVIPASIQLEQPLRSEYSRGGVVTVGLNWLPLNKIDAYYSFSARVVDEQGNKIVQTDRQPIVPTLLWVPDVPVPDSLALPLPPDLPAGAYRVQLLMYDVDGGNSILLLDRSLVPQESFTLGEFTVK
jgi:hypothetical protein